MAESASSPALEIHGLRKTYPATQKADAKEALKGVSLQVERGEFFGLLGPNGAGKSTLINILAGLVRKTSGAVRICGYDLEKQSRMARRSIGVVPQELIVDTFFTVRQALELHAGYYGVPKRDRRTSEIIEALGLTPQADINSRRLSGGMRRRLLIGKALVHNPPVLVLDEPTAGVDVQLRTQLWEYVRELNRNGTTVLLTTHYLEEAEELCERIAIINHGELVACDQTRNLISQMDRKQMTLRFEQPIAEVPPALACFDATVGEDGSLVICYRPSKVEANEIFNQCSQAGLTIRDVDTEAADLEDLFREVTTA